MPSLNTLKSLLSERPPRIPYVLAPIILCISTQAFAATHPSEALPIPNPLATKVTENAKKAAHIATLCQTFSQEVKESLLNGFVSPYGASDSEKKEQLKIREAATKIVIAEIPKVIQKCKTVTAFDLRLQTNTDTLHDVLEKHIDALWEWVLEAVL